MVFIAETATNTITNASLRYGGCEQILERFKPVRALLALEAAVDDWKTVINTAYFQRINLSAHGFYIIDTDRCGYDWTLPQEDGSGNNAKRGQPFNYFTQGVCVTEVQIDCLSGDCRILRADILMDVGKSINPALDIGQIEGAFMQGFGWKLWGDKEHPWVREGMLFTRGPGTYKIPAFNDVPIDFRVHLADTDNRSAVHSSKAVGEPPFFLGASALFAIKDAIKAARAETGCDDEYYPLDLPATSESCADRITALCALGTNGGDGTRLRPLGSL